MTFIRCLRRNTRGRAAFTLLEITVTLFIVVFVTTTIAVLVVGDDDEKFLLDNAEGIEMLFSKAKSHSILQREDCIVSLKGNALQAIGSPSQKKVGQFMVNPNMGVHYRPSSNLPWSKADERVDFSFRKSGLNVPLQLRLSYPKGTCEMQLDVLTGQVLRSIKLR